MQRIPLVVLCWRAGALVALGLGLIGVLVPGLPTVPFLLLAAWSGSHGWPAVERWLLGHPRYGELIRHWRARRAIPRRAKLGASVMMVLSTVTVLLLPSPLWLRILLPLTLLAVATWIWRRPDE